MQRITPYVLYEDLPNAMKFLESGFGFHTPEDTGHGERGGADHGGHGQHHQHSHVEMELDGCRIMLGAGGSGFQSPARSGQACAMVHVRVDDVDAHYARATAAGATIVVPLEDRRYGDRGYSAADPEGQRWWFVEDAEN